MREESTEEEQSNFRRGLMFAIAGTALFGMKSIFIKLAFAEGVDASTLLALRMIIAFPLYSVILWWTLRKNPQIINLITLKDPIAILALGFVGYYLASILDFQGLEYISAQLERLVLFTYPIMVALLSWVIFSEKITKRVWVSLAFTYTGIVFLYAYESSAQSASIFFGTSLVALAAFSFAFYVIFSKAYIMRFGSMVFTSFAMLSSTLFVLIHFFVTHTHSVSDLNVSATAWLFAALLGIVSTLIPSFLVSEAISRIGGTKTSIAGSVGPVFTVMLAVFVLGEDFGWPHFFGMILVILGILVLDSRSFNGNLFKEPLIKSVFSKNN